ncbi:MAG: electron transfer flavoprotein subunit alpha/FixB family protein [Chloroflexi bacterium]|nr:electron transfer flavoprotein subunit alpha/FixB family protein [Chloroflexota bacterium]
MSDREIWVFAQHADGRPADPSLEALSAARKLADWQNGTVTAISLGPGARNLVAALGEHGADRVIVCDDTRLSGYAPEATVHLLADLVRGRAPLAILFGDAGLGNDLAARLAARLGCGFAPHCTSVEPAVELPSQPGFVVKRLAYNDKLQITLAGAQIITLQREAVEIKRAPRAPQVEEVALAIPTEAVRLQIGETLKADPRTIPLAQAEFIISGGNGVRNFAPLWALADRLGAAVGGSRVVCDDGRLPRERQIGESGTTVSPRCYLAFGISGASQHLRGMQDSKLIIVVNSDRHAPLMKLANLAVVADAEAVIRAMVERL